MNNTVKPYQEEGSKKKQVSQMFDKIAPFYDLLNRVLSLGIDVSWRKKMIKMMKQKNPKTILDVATGTADVAIETAKQISPDQIKGIDISSKMIEIGRKKIEKNKLSQVIQLDIGDSENLDFEDQSFDAITVAFGVRNFENLEKGLKEMQRVLKKGGEMYILEFSHPTVFPFKQIFNAYFKYILPTIGKLTSKDPKAYKYLYESVQAFPNGPQFDKILKELGFNNTKFIPLTLGICTIYVGEK